VSDDPADYTVKHCEHGVYVVGFGAPSDEMSNLLRALDYRGLKHLSVPVAKRLGALFAACRGTGDAELWLRELGEET